MAKHSPGPWASEGGTVYVVEGDERQECVSEIGRPFIYHTKMVALVYSQDGVSADDNASLIAKVPKMYQALKTLCEAGARGPSGHDWMRANALIAEIEATQ